MARSTKTSVRVSARPYASVPHTHFRALMTEQGSIIEHFKLGVGSFSENIYFAELLLEIRNLNTVLATPMSDRRKPLARIAAVCESWDKNLNSKP